MSTGGSTMKTKSLKRFTGLLVSVLMVGSSFVLGGALTASAATPAVNVKTMIDFTTYYQYSHAPGSAPFWWEWTPSGTQASMKINNQTITTTNDANLLVLDNMNLSTTDVAGIKVPTNTIIELVGTNVISAPNGIGIEATDPNNIVSQSSGVGDKIIFDGTGTLTVNGKTYAVDSTGTIGVNNNMRVTDPINAFAAKDTAPGLGNTIVDENANIMRKVTFSAPKLGSSKIADQNVYLGTKTDWSTSLSSYAYTLGSFKDSKYGGHADYNYASDKTTVIGLDATTVNAVADTLSSASMVATFMTSVNSMTATKPWLVPSVAYSPIGVLTTGVPFNVNIKPLTFTLNPQGGVTWGNHNNQNQPGGAPSGGFLWTGTGYVNAMSQMTFRSSTWFDNNLWVFSNPFMTNTKDWLQWTNSENQHDDFDDPVLAGYTQVGWSPVATTNPIPTTNYDSTLGFYNNKNGYWVASENAAANFAGLGITPDAKGNVTLYAIWKKNPTAVFPVAQVIGPQTITMDQSTAKSFSQYYALTDKNMPDYPTFGTPNYDQKGRPMASLPQTYTFADNLSNASQIASLLSWNGTTQQITMQPGAPIGTYSVKFTLTNSAGWSATMAIQIKVTVGSTAVVSVPRLAGADRFGTAAAIAAKFSNVTTVYLANAYNFPDALAAVPLAAASNSPILLTTGTSVPSLPAGTTKVVLLGGTGVISSSVQTALQAKGITVQRLGGADRYATDEAIANATESMTNSTTAFVVSGINFPDALSIAPVAGIKGAPVLFANASGLAPASQDFLKNHKNITSVVIVGGPSVTGGANTVSQLNTLGVSSSYVYGANRYATAAAVATQYKSLFGSNVTMATGALYPDALTGGVYSAQLKAPLLLVDPGYTSYAAGYVATVSNPVFCVYGGAGAGSVATEPAAGGK
jgi:putative cell wall-binding protein